MTLNSQQAPSKRGKIVLLLAALEYMWLLEMIAAMKITGGLNFEKEGFYFWPVALVNTWLKPSLKLYLILL